MYATHPVMYACLVTKFISASDARQSMRPVAESFLQAASHAKGVRPPDMGSEPCRRILPLAVGPNSL